MTIEILHKNDNNEFKRYCLAKVIYWKEKKLKFETQEFLPEALGRFYYVEIKQPEGTQAQVTEILLRSKDERETTNIYEAELGLEYPKT